MAGASHKVRPKTERLEARVTREEKERFALAAQLSGRSLTDFMLANLHEAARRAFEAHNTFLLSEVDTKTFADALADPPEPSDALRRAVDRFVDSHRSRVPT